VFCVLAGVLTGCATPLTCGPDTKVESGRCVPTVLSRCGEGTKLVGADCVPAAPLTCGPGTVASEGSCLPAASLTCGAGTEEKGGVCVLLDPLRRVTVPEGAEPNIPPGRPARFTVPEPGAAPVVLGGVIGPVVQGQPDFDGFAFTGHRLQRLHVEGKAIGAPSVGFALQPCKAINPAGCDLDTVRKFPRFALTSSARGAGRDLVIPWDGDFVLLVSDESNLSSGLPFGGADFSYTVDVTQVPQPEPAPLTPGTAATGVIEAIEGHALDVTSDQTLFDVTLAAPAATASGVQRALWASGADGSLLLSTVDDTTYGFLIPIAPVRLAFPPGRSLLFVDDVFSLAADSPYSLLVSRVPTVSLGTLATPFEQRGSLDTDGNDVYAVDLPGGGLLDVDAIPLTGSQIAPQIELRNAKFEVVATVKDVKLVQYVGAAEAGRYYVVVVDRTFGPAKTSLGYFLKARRWAATVVGPVGVGASGNASGTVGADLATWYAVYAGNDEKLRVVAHPNATSDLTVSAFTQGSGKPFASANTGAAGADEALPDRLVASGNLLLVRVEAAAGAAFTLTATGLETTAVFEQEANDDQTHANRLTLDAQDHAEAAGRFDTSYDTDFYALTLDAPKTLLFETHPGLSGGSADTRLAVLSPAGAVVAQNDDFNGSRLAQLTTTLAAGTWYVRIQRWNAGAPWDANDYGLTVDPAVP
jgi:hypothetical protein